MEKIVIATDIPGNRELIKHKETGLSVPIKSPISIAKAIDFIQNNKKQSKDIAKKGKTLIEKEFSAERAGKKFKKI